jgi:hypothetical protein
MYINTYVQVFLYEHICIYITIYVYSYVYAYTHEAVLSYPLHEKISHGSIQIKMVIN